MDQVFLSKYPHKSRRVISTTQLARLIPVSEFAKQNHIVERTAYYWAKSGRVWATKIGSRWYFDPIAVVREKP